MHRVLAPRTLRCLLLASSLLAIPAEAADPQPYTVTLAPTGRRRWTPPCATAPACSRCATPRPSAPSRSSPGPARTTDRLEAALGSFGYYDGRATIRIAGRDLDDPGLPAALDAAPGPVAVTVAIARGPEYTLRRVSLDSASTVPPEARAALKLSAGQPALAADVLAAQGRMLDALRAPATPWPAWTRPSPPWSRPSTRWTSATRSRPGRAWTWARSASKGWTA